MGHIKQNDSRLLEPIQKIGCFFRSCGIIAENKTGKELSAEKINAVWKWAKDVEYIDKNDNVRFSAPIATRFLRELGDEKGRFIEVGTFRGGKTTFYVSIRKCNPELMRIDALIQKIIQGGPSRTHFRVVNKNGALIEDPHAPPINPLSIEYSILYAYIAE